MTANEPWGAPPVIVAPRDRGPRRVLTHPAFITALVAAVALAVVAGLFWSQKNDARQTLHRTRQQLSAMTRERDSAREQVTGLQSTVDGERKLLADSQSQLAASQQLASEVGSVADSLKTCVDANSRFESDFSAELGTGMFSPFVTQEAQEAAAACSQANSDYQTLLSALRLAGVGVNA